jgi:NAD(P)-dependent dehydrogenase (short-subunit alcohol dehydrogenase family)
MNVNVFSNKIILDYLLNTLGLVPKNIIGISSGASMKTYYGWGTYCVSKAAFNQLISSYSDEYPEIHFISLSPGAMKTKMQDLIQKESKKRIPSVEKFQNIHESIQDASEAAKKIAGNLKKLNVYKSGSFIEIKDLEREI